MSPLMSEDMATSMTPTKRANIAFSSLVSFPDGLAFSHMILSFASSSFDIMVMREKIVIIEKYVEAIITSSYDSFVTSVIFQAS